MENKYKKILNKLVQEIISSYHDFNIDLFKRAYKFSYEAHQDQIRSSGQPFFEHPLEVSKILINYHMDIHTICGGLLHDVAEDTGVTIEEVEEKFGEEIALLVDGVTKISGIDFDSFETQQVENFRKMIVSMVKDIRVILIKFADRLHNMRTIDYLPEKKKKRISIETRDVYAPLAHRLGLCRIETELEDRVFRTLDYNTFNSIEQKINNDRNKRQKYIQEISTPILKELKKSNISDVKITAIPRHFYNIYIKMKQRKLPYEEISDSFFVRIIVQKVEQCYFVLGIVHKLFTPVHDHFKDYIATPKSNMYQSLHTIVIGPDGKMIKIQIRTEEMDKMAENGIAVHWLNKGDKINEVEIEKQFVWLRKLLEWQQDTKDSDDFMENFRNDLFHDEVFIFTPDGDLHRLPRGSTPVDCAFYIHTDIGYHCIGAKVNRRVVPLNYQFKSGDIVEIITSEKQQPNPEWIKFVKTAKARSKIKRWATEIMFDHSLRLGKEILNVEFNKLGIKQNDDELIEIAQSYGLDDINQLYVAIGRSDIYIGEVIKKIAPDKLHDGSMLTEFIPHTKGSLNGIKIQGIDNFLVTFGKCCQPIPGDRILGFISEGHGIEVHRADCKKITDLLQQPNHNINVEWDVDKNKQFLVQLKMLANNRTNFLKDISESMTSTNTNLVSMTLNTDGSFIHNTLVVEVKNRNQLIRVMNKIRDVEGVISVDRLNSEAN